MARLGLLGTGLSSIMLRKVQQIKKLQVKKTQQTKKIDLQITNEENSAWKAYFMLQNSRLRIEIIVHEKKGREMPRIPWG